MNVFRQIKDYYWNDRWMLFISLGALTVATALGVVYPYILKHLIDDIIKPGLFDQIPTITLLVFSVIAVKAGFQLIHGLLGGRLGNRVAYNLRKGLYKKLQYLSFQYYDTAKTGDLMSRLTADLEAIRQFIGFGFAQLLNLFLMVGFGSMMMFFLNWKLTLIILMPIPVLAYFAFRFERTIHPAFRLIRKSMSDLTTAVQENITGVRTIKSFAREPHEVLKFEKHSENYRENHVNAAIIWSRYFPLLEVLASVCVVILVLAGGYMVIDDQLTIGELVAFFGLIWYIIGPMWGLGFHINNYTQSKASIERVLEILLQYVHVKDMENPIELQDDKVRGHIEYQQVTFAYPDTKPAIVNLSIDAPPGKIIGLLGGTGSGKSTVIQLLMRAYNIKEGRIMLDGKDIRNISIESLRRQISVVFQETFLFSSTIRNNISYGNREISIEQIEAAAKTAKAHDFIMELPLGYDTIVGERGLGLSGGQKQRIAIARAILKNPKILILDDATSAVDMETEHDIQSGLREMMKGRTTFIIAHRISSLRHANEIIVLNQGEVVQRGSHEQLISMEGHYLDTYRIQFADGPEASNVTSKRRAVL